MRTLRGIVLLTGLLALVGCGGDYVSVSGVVLLDGEPVHDAAVSFVPEDGSGEGAGGYTDEQGRFTLTSKQKSGIRPGKYKVTIESLVDRPAPSPGIGQVMAAKHAAGGDKGANKQAKDLYEQQVKDAKKSKAHLLTPAIYASQTNTPLKADVPAQTEYKFELKKDAK